jgi:hypothetical protein
VLTVVGLGAEQLGLVDLGHRSGLKIFLEHLAQMPDAKCLFGGGWDL